VYPSDSRWYSDFRTTNYQVFDAIANWDVSNVVNMDWMFYGNEYFNTNLDNWNVNNCKDFTLMFEGCEFYNQPMNSWNINTSDEVKMHGMFKNAKNFNKNLSNWNVSSVTTMYEMFRYADDFNNGSYYTSADNSIALWDVSSCRNFDMMFYDTSINIDLSTWCVEDAPFPYGFATLSPLDADFSRWPNFGDPC
jgi:surface protein